MAEGMVKIPELNSKIFYLPQDHAEHAYEPVNFLADFKIPSNILCRVAAFQCRDDPFTDEVYVKLRLVPLHISEVSFDDDDVADLDNIVAVIQYKVDPATNEVYAKLKLVPLHISEVSFDDDDVVDIDNMCETKNTY
ncbi:auxin response factor 16-like [Vicia villosa]|uniref:auxin response factor 16-like n=1 Tax=Vicia villosa TaxID=3911 RepID=UPI00273B12C0|nr:auxin response factor 16-like [Vicia villosa]